MKDILNHIKDFKETEHKNELFLIISEKSKKIQLPTYSLIHLLNTHNKSSKIMNNQGWIEEC